MKWQEIAEERKWQKIGKLLAELIEYDLECNEAPDSRSLVQYLETGRPNAELRDKPILTQAPKQDGNVAIRKKDAKYIPGTKELYNLSLDPETKNVK